MNPSNQIDQVRDLFNLSQYYLSVQKLVRQVKPNPDPGRFFERNLSFSWQKLSNYSLPGLHDTSFIKIYYVF